MNKVQKIFRDMSFDQNPKLFFLVVRALVLFLLLAVIFLTVFIVESNYKTNDKFSDNAVKLETRLNGLNDDFRALVRADCPFLLKFYLLPNESTQRPPGKVLLEISSTAHDSYYAKDCPSQKDASGKVLGMLPPLDP